MHKEYECTILEIDTKFISKLENMGAKKIGEYFQKRYVYDFNPINENKWIRLRTNGIKTTLAIKEVINKNEIGGTNEIEIEVSDFENTNNILKELGYVARNYQENKRIKYLLDDVNIDIDSWPLIPTYAEIEGKSEEEVKKIIAKLEIDSSKITTMDVTSIYMEIYGNIWNRYFKNKKLRIQKLILLKVHTQIIKSVHGVIFKRKFYILITKLLNP